MTYAHNGPSNNLDHSYIHELNFSKHNACGYAKHNFWIFASFQNQTIAKFFLHIHINIPCTLAAHPKWSQISSCIFYHDHYNECDGISNHRHLDCLLSHLFRHRSKKTSLSFVRGIHQWPVDSPHKGPVSKKMFPFDYVMSDWRPFWLRPAVGSAILCPLYSELKKKCFIN